MEQSLDLCIWAPKSFLMGATVHVPIILHLLFLTFLGIIGGGAKSLTRRWVDTSPFQHIKLHMETQNLKAPVPGWGCFRAAGRVAGPVTKEQFILFTDTLSREASARWHGAEGSQYHKGPNPLPPRGAGQLTGSGRNLYFQFLTDQRPIRDWKAGQSGLKLLSDSHHNQLRLFFPGKMNDANMRKREARRKMEGLTKVMSDIQMTRLKTYKGEGHPHWLDRWYDVTAAKRTAHAEDYNRESQLLENLLEITKHSFGNRCVECRLMTEAADRGRRRELYKAWQVSFGAKMTAGKTHWGPLPPCWGKGGTQYGCVTVQQDNGVVNLYETAVKLQNIGHGYGGRENLLLEFMECKRGKKTFFD